MYKIETANKDNVRTGCIKNAGQALNQTSEYDYIFSKVYSYRDKAELTRDELVTCGNIARKLVEAFLSFKFPKQRANLEQLLEKALPRGGENDITRERIYKFINMYSHHLKIDIFDELDEDNTLSETTNVMRDILDMIKQGKIKMVINTLTHGKEPERDGFKIRRSTVEHAIPCLTSMDTAQAVLHVLTDLHERRLVYVLSLQDYVGGRDPHHVVEESSSDTYY
jgi:hypothetical protein